MFKKILFLSLVILFGFSNAICLAKYSGGDGSESNPYRISNPYDMNDIGLHDEDWASHFVLTDDIDLAQFTGTQFNIIGEFVFLGHPDNKPFTGVFDGNGFTISNFNYQITDTDNIGLFSYVDGAEIKDLTLIDTNVNAGTGNIVGSLVGFLYYGNVTNCCVEGGHISGVNGVGGLVGRNRMVFVAIEENDTPYESVGINQITDSYTTNSVSGSSAVGGLVGCNDGTIKNCYAVGNVVGSSGAIGGMVGVNSFARVSNCYAAGDVVGDVNIGGLVGKNYATEISNCYATGSVTGSDNIGGLVGSSEYYWYLNWLSGITHCYAIGDVSGTTSVGGLLGYSDGTSYTKCFWDSDANPDINGIGNDTDPNVIGETTENMQKETTFTSVGWDFVGETINGPNDIWTINDGNDYPIHVWPLVNFVGWYEVDLKDYSFFARCWMDNMPCSSADLVNNGFIDLEDFAHFAGYWLLTSCGTCGGADLTGDGDVNNPDLLKFADCWLKTNCRQADLDFSGSIDNKDLAIFTKYWLIGLQ